MKKNYILYFLLFLYFLFILYYLHPLFLSNEIIAGWDSITHIYTLEKYPSELIKGNFIYNDPFWFNGYTAYQYYPPLFFILISIINLFFFNLISVVLILKILILIFVFLFIYSLYILFNRTFNIKKEYSIILSIFSSFFWLFSNVVFDCFGIGFSSIFQLGEFSNFLGIVIGIFLINFAHYFFKLSKRSFKDYLFFVFLFSSLLLTHIFSFFFFSFFLFFIFIFNSIKSKKLFLKNLKSGLIVIFFTLFISSFWLIPFLKYIKYSNAILVFDNFNLKVVLFYLFPFNYLYIYVFFIFFLLIGIIFLFKNKKIYFLYFFIIFLLFSFGLFSLPLTLHQYRFFAYVYLFYVVFISLGIYFSYILINNIKNKFYRKLLNLFLLSVLLFIFIMFFILIYKGEMGIKKEYNFTLDKYDSYSDSDFLINYLKLNNAKMVFAEQSYYLMSCNYSPHYFEYILSKNNILSLLGLYTESSQTSLLFPFIYTFSENYNWLVKGYKSKFINNDFNSFIDRLKMYNVDYVLVSSNKLKYYLDSCSDCKLVYNYYLCDKEHFLYNIKNNYSKYEIVNNKLILFYSKKDGDWIDFSKLWFESSLTYRYPLVRIKEKDEIFNFDNNYISAIVISNLKDINKFNKKYNIFYSSSKDSIVLNHNSNLIYSDILKIYKKENSNFSLINIVLEKKDVIHLKIISTEPVGVLIRKSYSPFWKAYDLNNQEIKIYEYSPNFMFVYTTGDVILKFKIPLFLKVLFIMYILFLFFVIFYVLKSNIKRYL